MLPRVFLIFYDYRADVREANERYARWLDCKIAELRAMAEQAREWWPENEASEYLLIVGSVTSQGDLPQWRHFRNFIEDRTIEQG